MSILRNFFRVTVPTLTFFHIVRLQFGFLLTAQEKGRRLKTRGL